MRTLVVVKLEVVLQPLVGLIQGVISLRIDLLIFDRSPQPFDKDIGVVLKTVVISYAATDKVLLE